MNPRTAQGDETDASLPPPENRLHYPALDGLRAVAVCLVFFQHYIAAGTPAISWGWTGVDFFFVLSGFLITGILYDTRDASRRFLNFYGRRTVRIFPLYYGVLLATLLVDPIFHWQWPAGWYLWPVYLGNYDRFLYPAAFAHVFGGLSQLYTGPSVHPPFRLLFGHFWSLCIEEQFYLVWPLVVFRTGSRTRLRNLCLAVWIACLALRTVCVFVVPASYLNMEFLYRATPFRADALLLGGLVALALRGPEARLILRAARPVFLLGIAGLIAGETLFRVLTHHFYAVSSTGPLMSTVGFSLIDVFAASVLLLALHPGGRVYSVLHLRPLRSLGKVSYGFYVFHDIPHVLYILLVTTFLPGIRHPGIYVAAIAFLMTLLLSYSSFYFFEKPFLRLKRFFV